jgi:hypothetical protein
LEVFFRTLAVRSSIAGLLLLKHELEFLGLFDVDERGSARQWLPAKKVSVINWNKYDNLY